MPRSPAGRPQAGFSQLELLFAIAVLMVAALSFSSAMVTSMHLADSTREHTLASEAARRVLEEMQDAEFDDLLALYDDDPTNDPGGVVVPGSRFAVSGLTPAVDDADGFVGSVEFPLSEGKLLERAELPEFGLPRDLDGSGTLDDADHSTGYALLPVRISVRWRTDGAPMEVTLRSFLAQR